MALRRKSTQRLQGERERSVKVRFLLAHSWRQQKRDDPTSSWCHNELKFPNEDERSLFRREIFQARVRAGDQILKILLWSILLFNKRVVQPTSMVYIVCVWKRSNYVDYDSFLGIQRKMRERISEKFTNYKWNFHVPSWLKSIRTSSQAESTELHEW